MYSKFSLRGLAAWAALGFALLFPGCGGGKSSAGDAGTRTGQVQLHILWPAQIKTGSSRYIPAYAASLFFELSPKGQPSKIYTLIVNRPANTPATQDVTFTQLLSSGTYELAGAARALPDAQGATVASGAVEVNVHSGMNPVSLTLNSTVKTLQVLGQPLSAGVGQSVTLQSGAFDPDGNGLLLPDGALTWSIVSGSQFGTITAGGKFTGTAAGTLKVRVSEPVTKVFADATITVTSQGSTAGLAKSGYPKAGVDVGNTSLVTGSGATGQIAWNFDLGTRGVNTPVLGNNNLLFALNQKGVVFALNALTGAKVWQATLPNLLGELPTGSLVVSDDNTLYVGYSFGIQAYDAGTGLPKWTNVDYRVNANMTLSQGKLYVPTNQQGIAVIDIRTGTSLTTYAGLEYTYDPVIANGLIYYVTEAFSGSPRSAVLNAVNLTTGAVAWSNPLPDPSGYNGQYPVASSDGSLYFSSGDGNLYLLDGLTGKVKKMLPASLLAGFPEPAIGSDGSITFLYLDPTNFSTRKTARYNAALTQKIWSADPVFRQYTVGTDGTVYGAGDVAGLDQTALYALNGVDGTVKWKVPLTRGVSAAPPGFGQVPGYAAVGPTGMVYVVSIDQQVYAIK